MKYCHQFRHGILRYNFNLLAKCILPNDVYFPKTGNNHYNHNHENLNVKKIYYDYDYCQCA